MTYNTTKLNQKLPTFFWIFSAFFTALTAAAACGFFCTTPFCCLTGTPFFGLAIAALAGVLGLAATLAAGFLPAGAALAPGLAALALEAAPLAPAAALAAGALAPAALAAAGALAAALAAEAFFSAGLEPEGADAGLAVVALAAALGAGAGVFEEPADDFEVPEAEAAGAVAGFFFSSFLAAENLGDWVGCEDYEGVLCKGLLKLFS